MRDDPLLARLEAFADLRDGEKALLGAVSRDVHKFRAKRHIIKEGERPERVHLIIDGWAARYKVLKNGSRQIVAFLLPGDFCDLHVAILGHMDHGIVALTDCKVALIKSDEIDELTSGHGNLARALWWGTLVDEAILRSWVLNSRRNAYQRVAHILCELHARLKLIGMVSDGQFDLPLTQEEIADATGLTLVHTNRTLQRLRREHLIKLANGLLTVLDAEALRFAAEFDPNYLHIQRRKFLQA